MTNSIELLNIEEKEKNILFKLGSMFKSSLDEFSTSIDRSLNYLDKIVLSIIMASTENKSYNPFAEIIEKYALHILIKKFQKEDYKLLPLGYSADLTLENDDYILNIDIKTANIDNPSDFRNTINIGINQTTHVAKLKLNRTFLPEPYFIYPTIPPFYKKNDKKKYNFTYGLMFIYPSYRDLIEEIRNDYIYLFEFFNKKLKQILIPIIKKTFEISEEEAKNILENKPKKSSHSKDKIITENLIRGIFIHEHEKENILKTLNFNEKERKVIEKFSIQLNKFINKLKNKDIKPIAIIAISIPNGLLKEKYLDKFVSGKDYGKSARYHYDNAIFEIIKEQTKKEFPRVVFIDLNIKYLDQLKNYFNKIIRLNYQLEEL